MESPAVQHSSSSTIWQENRSNAGTIGESFLFLTCLSECRYLGSVFGCLLYRYMRIERKRHVETMKGFVDSSCDG